MKPALLFVALCTFSVINTSAQNGPTPEQRAKQQVGAASAAVGRAIEANDFTALEKLWSPTMVVNSPANRVLTRAQVFDAMRAGELRYANSKASIESFTFYNDIAVVMGHEDMDKLEGSNAGKHLQLRFTNIWQRSGETWIQIARQGTIVSNN